MDVADELAQLKKRRRSVKPDNMHKLLAASGFERRYGKGDHWIYTHPRLPHPLSIDPRNPLATRLRVQGHPCNRGGADR